MPDPSNLSPSALAYGRLAIATLAATTLGSAGALTVALAVVLSAGVLRSGPPYGDLPVALLAIGGAASLACLASAAAYGAQASRARDAERLTRRLHVATAALMSAAYVAFAIGGLVFSHFCLASAAALARPAPGAG